MLDLIQDGTVYSNLTTQTNLIWMDSFFFFFLRETQSDRDLQTFRLSGNRRNPKCSQPRTDQNRDRTSSLAAT